MNERIKQFAEQATKHYPATETSGEFSTFDEEKFAELVVKDFQKLIKDVYLNTAPEHRDCLLMLDARVEEHFGVEQ